MKFFETKLGRCLIPFIVSTIVFCIVITLIPALKSYVFWDFKYLFGNEFFENDFLFICARVLSIIVFFATVFAILDKPENEEHTVVEPTNEEDIGGANV